MSLYGKNPNQGSAIGGLVPASGLPMWILVLAVYFVVINLMDVIPDFVQGIKYKYYEIDELKWNFLTELTCILSVILLAISLFRHNALILYYASFNALISLVSTISLIAGATVGIRQYFFFMGGLNGFPFRILSWVISWDKLSDPIRYIVWVVNDIVTIAFCVLLLYFKNKRQLKV